MAPEHLARRDVLFARLDVLSWRLAQGEDTDPNRLIATTNEAMELAPELSIEDRQLLMNRLVHAQAAVLEAQSRITARLEALPNERRATRTYVGHSNTRPITGRLSRRV